MSLDNKNKKHSDRLYQLPIGSTFELALAVFSAGFCQSLGFGLVRWSWLG